MLAEVKITAEILQKLRELYPEMATYGDSVLVTYALEHHTYTANQHTARLPHFLSSSKH